MRDQITGVLDKKTFAALLQKNMLRTWFNLLLQKNMFPTFEKGLDFKPQKESNYHHETNLPCRSWEWLPFSILWSAIWASKSFWTEPNTFEDWIVLRTEDAEKGDESTGLWRLLDGGENSKCSSNEFAITPNELIPISAPASEGVSIIFVNGNSAPAATGKPT